MGNSDKHRKTTVASIAAENRVLSPRPKARYSFLEGFYVGDHFYNNIFEWVHYQVREADEKDLVVVYHMTSSPETGSFWDLLNQTFIVECKKVKTDWEEVQNTVQKLNFGGQSIWVGRYCNYCSHGHAISFHGKRIHKTKKNFSRPELTVIYETLKMGQISASKVQAVETHPLLVRHNTPELMHRRKMRIAESNARHSKKFDDAMTGVLTRFQKLTF
jgi:hypothetical protein